MPRFAQGKFTLKFPKKYIGTRTPTYRSSWEFHFMKFCDEHPSVEKWASESIRIPYRNPLTGKQTIYVPDFIIVYQNKNGTRRGELIEIKPQSQTMLTEKTSQRDKMAIAVNHAKWSAAANFCKLKGLTFRVVTENDIFHQGKKRR